MSGEQDKKEPTKDEADKTPKVEDLEPEKDPAGGTSDHSTPPGQAKKSGGEGGA